MRRGKWMIRLNMVTPEGSYIEILNENEKGKRAVYDFLPGSLIMALASSSGDDASKMDPKHVEAMERCLDVLWPEWRTVASKYESVTETAAGSPA